jgi:hypothetical protein
MDPEGASLWAAMMCPFLARLLVAWTVWLRIRGWAGGANIEPKRQRGDYPKPNDPVSEGVVLVVAAVVSSLAATVLGPLMLDRGVPSWVWTSLYAGGAIGSLTYAFRRVRADDRRQRRRLAERLTSNAASRPGPRLG